MFVSDLTHTEPTWPFFKVGSIAASLVLKCKTEHRIQSEQTLLSCSALLFEPWPIEGASGSTAAEPALDPVSLYHNTKLIHPGSLLFKIKTIMTLSDIRYGKNVLVCDLSRPPISYIKLTLTFLT